MARKTYEVKLAKDGKSFAFYKQDLLQCMQDGKEFAINGVYILKKALGSKTPKTIKISVE